MEKEVQNLKDGMLFILEGVMKDKNKNSNYLSLIEDEKDYSEIKEAIEEYSSSKHYKINEELSKLKPGDVMNPQIYYFVKNLKEAMNEVKKLRFTQPFKVYRGLDIPFDHSYVQSLLVLKDVNNNSFLSTSLSKKVGITFTDCCLLEIDVKPTENLHYIYITKKGEEEILFEPQTYLHYISHRKETDKEEEKEYTLIRAELRKGSVILETKKTTIKSDFDMYEDIKQNLGKYIDEDDISDAQEWIEGEKGEDSDDEKENDKLAINLVELMFLKFKRKFPLDYQRLEKFTPFLIEDVKKFLNQEAK